MVYSATPPATTPGGVSPIPSRPLRGCPFTRADCNVGVVATANMDLENTSVDIPKVFGASSPEDKQLVNDPDSYKDPETADYVGLAVHCAKGRYLLRRGQGRQVRPDPRRPRPQWPIFCQTNPGATTASRLCSVTVHLPVSWVGDQPNLNRNGYQVTNAKAGNIVDLVRQRAGWGVSEQLTPGSPASATINAAQTLAYMADSPGIGRAGDLWVYGRPSRQQHMAGLQCVHDRPGRPGKRRPAATSPRLSYYDSAFATFFNRLAADGITPATRSSSSVPTKATTRPGPTWAGPCSPRRRAVTEPRDRGPL